MCEGVVSHAGTVSNAASERGGRLHPVQLLQEAGGGEGISGGTHPQPEVGWTRAGLLETFPWMVDLQQL